MSRADDEIRQALRTEEHPVGTTGVFERVERRKRGLRVRRRVVAAGIAVVVVAGTVLGTFGLARLIGPDREVAPAGGEEPTVAPDESPVVGVSAVPQEECLLKSMDSADLNGDGRRDLVEVYFEPPSPETTCLASDRPGTYFAHVEISTGAHTSQAYTQELPECEAFGCGPFAGPDLDGDGTDEVAITLASGGPAERFALYRFVVDPAAVDGGGLVRLDVAPPGDPWDPEYGFPPGEATFAWYGSTEHQHGGWCTDYPDAGPSYPDPGRTFLAVTLIRSPQDPDVYHSHLTEFRLEGDLLVVESISDFPEATVRNDDPGMSVLEGTSSLCGSPIVLG